MCFIGSFQRNEYLYTTNRCLTSRYRLKFKIFNATMNFERNHLWFDLKDDNSNCVVVFIEKRIYCVRNFPCVLQSITLKSRLLWNGYQHQLISLNHKPKQIDVALGKKLHFAEMSSKYLKLMHIISVCSVWMAEVCVYVSLDTLCVCSDFE